MNLINKKKIIYILTSGILAISLFGCNSGGGSGSGGGDPMQSMNIKVTPNLTGVCSNVNSPCVSVTICDNNNQNCSTVDNVLLDTGSYGLRIFSSLLNQNTINALNPIKNNNNPIGECVSYGDGSQNWGQVVSANIQLSSSAIASNVPMQLINSSWNTPPSSCSNATTSPSDFLYNGVLGVGVYVQDGGQYYICNGSNCNTSYSMPTNQQVANPIAFLPSNNNGITISFPNISNSGDNNVTGVLNFGVNTNTQNTVTTNNVYQANLSQGLPLFSSTYNGNSYYAFLDTGTNTLSLTNPNVTQCGSPYTGFLCPSSQTTLNLSNLNSQNQPIPTTINIANTISLLNTGNSVFNNIGTSLSFSGANIIDYGLPYFFGKNVQIVFNGANSNLGNGPFWAW